MLNQKILNYRLLKLLLADILILGEQKNLFHIEVLKYL